MGIGDRAYDHIKTHQLPEGIDNWTACKWPWSRTAAFERVCSRFFYNEHVYGHGGRMGYHEGRAFVKDVLDQLEEMSGVPNNRHTCKRVLKIRQIADNDRKKVRKVQSAEHEILSSRGLPETNLGLFAGTYVFMEYF